MLLFDNIISILLNGKFM